MMMMMMRRMKKIMKNKKKKRMMIMTKMKMIMMHTGCVFLQTRPGGVPRLVAIGEG